MSLNRREFLVQGAAVLAFPYGDDVRSRGFAADSLQTRGVVLVPEDLSLSEWPDLAHRARLTTIALHHGVSPKAVLDTINRDSGQRFLEKCKALGLQVEYELHAMNELLPRSLFSKEPLLFRMNEKGERVPDANLCVHSKRALEVVAQNAADLARKLRPTTGRYFLWGDDGAPWCRCTKCRELSESDQAVLLENHLCRVLRGVDPRPMVAHLAYSNTLAPPTTIKPDPAVFLEYAPINRRYDLPYSQQAAPGAADSLSQLDANLRVFPAETAQVLEYWLDVSRFSGWKRPSSRVRWNREVFLEDLTTYRSRGIRHVTTFAAWIDQDYRDRFGDLGFIEEYGQGLKGASRQIRPRDDWKPAMRRVHAKFRGQPGTLAQFGDSITETRAFWSPLTGERKNAPTAFERAFQSAKEHLLPESWSAGKGPENGNQGGKTTRWALENVDAWLKRLNPEVAVILFGTNDLSGIETASYEQDLLALVRKCLDNATVVLLTTIPPRHGFEKKSGEFAEAARRVARKLSVPLIDYHAEIVKRRPDDWNGALERFAAFRDYEVPTLISRDGVHPSYPSRFQTDFSEEGLRSSGYTLRNYLTLIKYAELLPVLRAGK